MPVNQTHPQYDKYSKQWEKCRAAIEGEDDIKEARQLFLPKLEGQTLSRYESYKQRAFFFNASDRTAESLLGFLFRKPPVLTPDDNDFFNNMVLSRANFDIFLKMVAQEAIDVTRVGVMCDVDKSSEKKEAKLVRYIAEDIINWEEAIINGKTQLSMVVLRESAMINDAKDEFDKKCHVQYRVLDLFDGIYRQRVLIKEDDKWVIISTEFPEKGGNKLEFIPFVLINATNISSNIEKPILIDLVNINLSHYRSSADLEQGRHYTALPTPWVTGIEKALNDLAIGSGVAWQFEQGAEVGMLEFTGQGLGALEKAMAEKENMMAILGAQVLQAQKKAVESADTHKIKSAAEQSILSNLAHTIDTGMTWITKVCADWNGINSDDINIALNKDYVVATADPALVTAMFAMLQGNAISTETWFYNLKKWEMIPPGTTFEDEVSHIEMRSPEGI